MVNPVIEALRANNPYEQLISQIIFVESQPMFDLETKKNSEERYKSVLSDFDSTVSSLHSLLSSLSETFSNPFDARSAAFPKESGFSVSAADDTPLGTHSLLIERLASTDTRVSQQFTKAGSSLRSFFDTNGAQTFTINVANPTDEDESNRTDLAVTIDPSGATDDEILREIADAISVAMDDATDADTIDEDEGAFGSVVNETTDTARLSLRSGSTGYAGRLEFSDSADGLLSMLGVTQGAVATGTAGGMITDVGTSESDSGLNARFVLDGLTIYRGSNQVTDALDGITLHLLQTTEANADFTITPDTDSIKGQLNDFIKKYNGVLEFIKIQSNVDSDLEIRGPFAGDATFRSLRFEMRNLVSQRVDGQPSAGPHYLSDLGITINDDGTLALEDEEALTAALEEDTNAVQSLFGGENGVAKRLETMLDSYLGSKGIIDNRIDSVDQQIKRLGNRIETFQSRLDQREGQLRVQFANLQETMANFQSQQAFLGAFLGGGF